MGRRTEPIHMEHNPYVPYGVPRHFRKPRTIGGRIVRPVAGGRWGVRKLKNGRWRAYTSGSARTLNKTFDTWAEAMAHAVKVSNFMRKAKS